MTTPALAYVPFEGDYSQYGKAGGSSGHSFFNYDLPVGQATGGNAPAGGNVQAGVTGGGGGALDSVVGLGSTASMLNSGYKTIAGESIPSALGFGGEAAKTAASGAGEGILSGLFGGGGTAAAGSGIGSAGTAAAGQVATGTSGMAGISSGAAGSAAGGAGGGSGAGAGAGAGAAAGAAVMAAIAIAGMKHLEKKRKGRNTPQYQIKRGLTFQNNVGDTAERVAAGTATPSLERFFGTNNIDYADGAGWKTGEEGLRYIDAALAAAPGSKFDYGQYRFNDLETLNETQHDKLRALRPLLAAETKRRRDAWANYNHGGR